MDLNGVSGETSSNNNNDYSNYGIFKPSAPVSYNEYEGQ